jgi:hypothetical protein
VAKWDAERLMRLFRERLLKSLLDKHATSEELVKKLLAWRHPGFSAHVGEPIAASDTQRLEDTAAYGEYSSRARGTAQSAEAEAVVTAELAPRRRCSPSWARLIAKVYQVDPLVCTRCGHRMSILAYVSDQHSIGRILEHLGLRPPERNRPPPAREILRVAEQWEGWGVPANWD